MNADIELLDDLPCNRCSGKSYLAVRIPHPTAPSMMTFTLCPRCDADNAKAHGLLAYFAYHSAVEADQLDDFAFLVLEWAHSLAQPSQVPPEKGEEDWKLFRSDDY